jgi:hypothetical protein
MSLPCTSRHKLICDPEATRGVQVAFGLGFQTRSHYKLST